MLGLVSSRFGLSAIPAYIFAGIVLGPNQPELFSILDPSEVTEFVAELGIIFLLFFLGLEFSIQRLLESGRHLVLGGSVDLLVNATLGLVVGIIMFGPGFAAVLVGAAIYISSSAVTVKGLIDFRRLADEETVLVLAILVFEDLVIAFVLGFASGGGGEVTDTLVLAVKVLGFIVASLAASRWLARPIDRILDALPREFFLLFTIALVVGMSAVADELGLSEAIGALMAGVVLAETSVRAEIEERFLGFRDLFAALFFFVFGLTVDLEALGSVGWLVAASGRRQRRREAGRRLRRRASGRLQPPPEPQRGRRARRPRRVHDHHRAACLGERGDLGRGRGRLDRLRRPLRPATAIVGVVLMKESKRLGRLLFPTTPRRLKPEGGTRGE